MEFETDEEKKIYNKCKYIVKLWEHQFKKKNNRLPSKLDIKEASSDVKNAYKTYFYLKTKTLERSFCNLDGFNFDDESTSTDLNNINQNDNESKDAAEASDKLVLEQDHTNFTDSPKFNLDLNESKSATAHGPSDEDRCIKIDTYEDKTSDIHLSEKTSKSDDVTRTETDNDKSKHVKNATKKTEKKQTRSYLNNVSVKFSKRNPRKAFVPSGNKGLDKNKGGSPLAVSNKDSQDSPPNPKLNVFTMDTTIPDSQSEHNVCFQVGNDSKIKNMNLQSVNLVKDLVENKTRTLRTVDTQWLERISQSTQNSYVSESSRDSYTGNISQNSLSTVDDDDMDSDIIDDSEDEESPPRKKQKTINGKPIISLTRNISFSGRSSRSNDRDFNSEMKNDDLNNVERNEQSNSKQDEPNNIQKENCEQLELDKAAEELGKEHSHTEKEVESKRTLRSHSVTTGNQTSCNDKDMIPKTGTKRQRAKEIFEKKVKSGNLNDNFVRVNLKKKTYSRGKKHMNFSKYRTRNWKKRKMELHVEETSDALLPIEACELDNLPTLEEANERANKKQGKSSKNTRQIQGVSKEQPSGESDDNWDIENRSISEFLGIESSSDFKDPDETHLFPSEPLYTDIESSDTHSDVFEALSKFGYPSFRNGQELAIKRILGGTSTLVTLSTGSGKSLCYLLPAYLYSLRSHCITLVISPLVSLMDDQVANVPSFIKAASFHTAQTNVQKQKVKDAVAAGKITVLFVSPELLVSGERRDDLNSILKTLPPIAFACIDEAHCVSQWSHNFRPSYLLVCKILKESLKVNTLLGLTATATKATCDSIRKHFDITDEEGVISDVPLPDNLRLTVSKVTKKDEALLKLITSEEFSTYESVIVYCTRRDECEKVAGFLRTYLQTVNASGNKRKRVSILAECYHAGLSAAKRKAVQKAFMSGELKIVVATVAFGMGINKADIRAVIHYNLPRNVESYVQEVGRAGRDRLPAHCHVFLDREDMDKHELRRHAYSNSIDRHVIRKLLNKVFIPCQCSDECPKHEICFSIQTTVQDLDLPEENISTVLCYLELHEKEYISVLSPGYSLCKITYSSVAVLKEAARTCLPLAKAISLFENDVKDNMFEFPVVEVASALFISSGICKHKLKNLEWTTDGRKPKRSPLNVHFSDLGFRITAPGNLSKNELDDLLNNIYDQCVQNENNSLLQLEAIHSILLEAEKKSHDSQSDILRKKIREYFSSENPLESYFLSEENINEESIINDVRTLISTFRDVNFTGRAIARIFHGIQSPNFSAYTWARTKFWRSHIEADFHTISKIATKQILDLH